MSSFSNIKVTLKAAATLDGKIATATGHSKWITGEEARNKGHQLRHAHDAILVGVNTVLADDPELTVRGVENGKSPVRVILDSKARAPLQSKVFQADGISVLWFVGKQAKLEKKPDLPDLKIIHSPEQTPDVKWVLREMEKLGIKSLLVEGGSRVHSSFLKSKCVDELALFLAPKIIGGQEAISWCGDLGVKKVDDAPQWNINEIVPVGNDWLVSATSKF